MKRSVTEETGSDLRGRVLGAAPDIYVMLRAKVFLKFLMMYILEKSHSLIIYVSKAHYYRGRSAFESGG